MWNATCYSTMLRIGISLVLMQGTNIAGFGRLLMMAPPTNPLMARWPLGTSGSLTARRGTLCKRAKHAGLRQPPLLCAQQCQTALAQWPTALPPDRGCQLAGTLIGMVASLLRAALIRLLKGQNSPSGLRTRRIVDHRAAAAGALQMD